MTKAITKKIPTLQELYSDKEGMMTEQCAGLCAPGFYCPTGSKSAQAVPCGSKTQVCGEVINGNNVSDCCVMCFDVLCCGVV